MSLINADKQDKTGKNNKRLKKKEKKKIQNILNNIFHVSNNALNSCRYILRSREVMISAGSPFNLLTHTASDNLPPPSITNVRTPTPSLATHKQR